ncbi:MAG: T9SS type A sorting domain-containing protein [Bacteroidota bacterium]|nr:T9SS type A sorting domain-containing protein [Bacteroidota bacterium]
MTRSFIHTNRIPGKPGATFFFLIMFAIPFFLVHQAKAQEIDDEWRLLSQRLECAMTEAAQSIGNTDAVARPYYGLATNTLGWQWDGFSENHEGDEDYSHWIKAAVFSSEAEAVAWWEGKGLHHNDYDNSNDAIHFWDYKRFNPTDFIENHVIKVRGFDMEGYGVEGTFWWQKGRFVFEIGSLIKNTEAILVDEFLFKDALKTHEGALRCELFSPIKAIDHFVFIELPSEYYFCTCEEEPWAIAMDEFGNPVSGPFPDPATISIYSDGVYLNSWTRSFSGYNENNFGLSIQLSRRELPPASKVTIKIQYMDVTSTSHVFEMKLSWKFRFTDYPQNKVKYGDQVTISGIVENLEGSLSEYDGSVEFWDNTFYGYNSTEQGSSISFQYYVPLKANLADRYITIGATIPCCPTTIESAGTTLITIFIDDPTSDTGFGNATSVGGPGMDSGIDMVFDPDDPSTGYTIGEFSGDIEFDDLNLDNPSYSALYLAKLGIDENGNMTAVWADVISTDGPEIKAKKVIMKQKTERVSSFLFIGGGTITIHDEEFVMPNGGYVGAVTYDKEGNPTSKVFSEKTGSQTARHNGEDMVEDEEGAKLILGDFYEDILFPGSGVPGMKNENNSGNWLGQGDGNIYSQDLFLVKYDENGNLLWGFEANSNADPTYMPYVRGTAMAVDEDNNIYVAGEYGAGLTIGTTTMTSYGGFITKFDPDGNIIWTQNMFGESLFPEIQITALSTDHNGALYITGVAFPHTSFSGMIWDDWSGQGNDGRRVFIAKYNTEGEVQWVDFASIDDYSVVQYCNDMEIDSDGNIYITGRFHKGPIAFGEHELVPQSSLEGNWIIFVVSYNSNGEVLWAQMAGDEEHTIAGSDFDNGKGLSIDANDNCYLTGSFSGSIIFGEDTLTSKGGPDAFMVKISGPASTRIEELINPEPSQRIELEQNYPNPFSKSTTISYSLYSSGTVTIRVYDLLGNMVLELINEDQVAGEYSHIVNLSSLGSGVYFYQIKSGAEQHTRKMIVR